MPEFLSNTSPLLYLYRINGLDWLPVLCGDIRIPTAVARELSEGRRRGYDVPDPRRHEWITIADPRVVPSEWLNLDLGPGELAVLSLALEHSESTVLLDDRQARRIAKTAGLDVWGTLRVLHRSEIARLGRTHCRPRGSSGKHRHVDVGHDPAPCARAGG